MKLSKDQQQSILALQSPPTLPGGQDTTAMANRVIATEWLYHLSGRTNGLYTGLWQEFLESTQPET